MEGNKKFIERKNVQFSKGELIPLKDIGRQGKYFYKREAWTFLPQHNLSKKVFVFERMRLIKKEGKISHAKVKVGSVEYRFGYYIVGKIGRANNKWIWGQFCPIIPHQDLIKLLKKAKSEGVLLA